MIGSTPKAGVCMRSGGNAERDKIFDQLQGLGCEGGAFRSPRSLASRGGAERPRSGRQRSTDEPYVAPVSLIAQVEVLAEVDDELE